MLPRTANRVILATYLAALLAVPVSQAACDVAPPAAQSSADVAAIVARACEPTCPASASCDLGGDKFCGAFAGVVAGLGLPLDNEAALVDACLAEQPHCDLCKHAGVMCAIAGNDAAECVAAEAECNCLAVAAGAP